jgi:hypothetical protein
MPLLYLESEGVPPGTPQDQSAYMLGQRAAFQQCFREALPHQQTLGALQAVIADMRSSSDQFDGMFKQSLSQVQVPVRY